MTGCKHKFIPNGMATREVWVGEVSIGNGGPQSYKKIGETTIASCICEYCGEARTTAEGGGIKIGKAEPDMLKMNEEDKTPETGTEENKEAEETKDTTEELQAEETEAPTTGEAAAAEDEAETEETVKETEAGE